MRLFHAGVAGHAYAGKPLDIDKFEPIKRKPKHNDKPDRRKRKPRPRPPRKN